MYNEDESDRELPYTYGYPNGKANETVYMSWRERRASKINYNV